MANYYTYRDQIIEFVRKNPGCTKMDVAGHITWRRHPSKSYGPVNTAIRRGDIQATRLSSGRYRLFA